MHKYILKRLLLLIPILIGVTLVVFIILTLTPGDPARFILGPNASDETVAKLGVEMGLDDPMLVRYANYIKGVLKGDFGNSYTSNLPVVESIINNLPVTLKMALLATFFSSLIGIPLGIISALKHRSFLDVSNTIVSMFLMGLPGFWLALILMLIFSLNLKLLPSSGVGTWKHYILPLATLLTGTAASLMRVVRTTMLDTIRQDYIKTARAKGAPERVVIIRHALKNAMMIIVTQVGLLFANLLAGTVLIETVFGLPGLGTLTLIAIRSKDIPMVMANTIFFAIIFISMILLIDIIYAFIDPRIKAKYTGGK